MNIIRTLVTYNTLVDLVNLALSCKQLSRIMRDKYIARAEGLDGEMGYRELLDLSRMQELQTEHLKAKIYETVRLKIVHIDPNTHSFYALGTDCILEGTFVRYNDSFEVVKSRPGIRDVSAVDVAGETIVCASSTQLALSQPSLDLRIVSLTSQPTVSLRFLGEKRLLVVLRARAIEVYSASLMALTSIQSDALQTLLYVPSAEKSVFATVDWTNTVRSYLIKGLQCTELYAGQHYLRGYPIQAIWMLREVCGATKLDFLIVWFGNGEITSNEVLLGCYRDVRIRGKSLFCLSNNIKIFGIDVKSRQLQLQQTLEFNSLRMKPSLVVVWRHKAVLIGPGYIEWASVHENLIVPVSRNELPDSKPESVRAYGNYLLVQGKYETAGEEVGWTAVANFNANAMIERARIEEEAQKVLAEAAASR